MYTCIILLTSWQHGLFFSVSTCVRGSCTWTYSALRDEATIYNVCTCGGDVHTLQEPRRYVQHLHMYVHMLGGRKQGGD